MFLFITILFSDCKIKNYTNTLLSYTAHFFRFFAYS